jgi:hypothetical protein
MVLIFKFTIKEWVSFLADIKISKQPSSVKVVAIKREVNYVPIPQAVGSKKKVDTILNWWQEIIV